MSSFRTLFLLIAFSVSAAGNTKKIKIGNESALSFPTGDVLQQALRPPKSFPDGSDIPLHLQYTIYLDQGDILVPSGDDNASAGDPEAAVVFSAGEWSSDLKKQTINRCFGRNWMFFASDVEEVLGRKLLSKGTEMFTRIATNKENDHRYCPLTFNWNADYTKFRISGYFSEIVRSPLRLLAEPTFSLTAELMPYWAWKFGLKVKGKTTSELAELDEKCCPPKNSNACLGGGTIGTSGCETISKACGQVKPEDLPQCNMWYRKNLAAGLVAFGGYNIFPIGDVNGEPTGYYPAYLNAMTGAGVSEIFYGLKDEGDATCLDSGEVCTEQQKAQAQE